MNINLTLIGQMIVFALFVMFCMKNIWPLIIAAMQERAEKIADGLEAADRYGRRPFGACLPLMVLSPGLSCQRLWLC